MVSRRLLHQRNPGRPGRPGRGRPSPTLGFDRQRFDDLLGVSSSLSQVRSLNIAARGPGDRIQTAEEIAGQRATPLTEDQQRSIQQFLDPQVTGAQQTVLQRIASSATAGGLFGGAVSSQLGDLQSRFQADVRASQFGAVEGLVGGRLNEIQQRVAPLFQATAHSPTSNQNFSDVAGPILQGLSSLGLGGEAIGAVARDRGVTVRGGAGQTGVGSAFVQFLSPQRVGGPRPPRTPLHHRRQLQAVAQRHQQNVGGRALQDAATGRLRSLVSGSLELGGLVAGGRVLQQAGTVDAARQLAGADVSGIRGLLSGLGFGGVPGRSQTRTSALFRTIGFS